MITEVETNKIGRNYVYRSYKGLHLRRPTCALERRIDTLVRPDQDDFHQPTAGDAEDGEGYRL
jgi:hypothetical protein